MQGIFITGTDTGVGKTVVTGLLERYLAENNYKVLTRKWVAFKTPCSPHLASRLEKRRVNPAKIIKNFKNLSGEADFVIVEGTGGALVPYSRKGLIIDMAKKAGLPAIIVSRNKLGAINHTLLTIEALRSRKIRILGIIFNNLNKQDKRILEDNPRIVRTLSAEKIFGALPKINNKDKLYKKFIPIGRRIHAQLD